MALVFAACGGGAKAELKPLLDILQSDDLEPSYIAIRCSGLFMAMAKWAGEDQLGSEAFTKLLTASESLIGIASELRADKNNTTGAREEENVGYNVTLVAQSYLDRFQENYTNNGSAWSSDLSFQADLNICTELSSQTTE